MTGVKWQGAIIVSSWWKHPSQLDIWSRCGPSAWAQRSHSVTRVLLCWRTNAQAKNIQCQMTIWMFNFSSKNGISKVGVQRMGRGKHIFLTQKEQAPSLFILCRKKKWKHRTNHIFLKAKNGENKHNAPNYRRTIRTHTLPSTHSKLQSHPDLRWTHSSQWDENYFLNSAPTKQSFNTLQIKFRPTNPKSMKHSSNNELEEAHTIVRKQKQIIWF